MQVAHHRIANARVTAERLNLSERTVRRWIVSGRLRAEKRGRAFIIDLDDAERVLLSSRSGTAHRARDEIAELRGRYAELQERFHKLEDDLAEERRRVGWLQANLSQRLAA